MKHSAWALAVLFGVAVVLPAAAEIIGNTDTQVQTAATPLLDTVLQGLADENYEAYTRYFDAPLKDSIAPERFQQISQQIKEMFGAYLYREYLGFLNKAGVTVIVWKGVFDKTANDVLIKMVVSRQGGQDVITGLWFE